MTKFLKNIQSGSTQLGFQISYPAPGIIERIGRDWDWIWIDGQHGQLGYQDILALVRVCDCMECAPVVRVASHEYAEIGRVLDTNPAGLIVPMVQTAQEARRVVEAAKYPPLGRRSYGGRRVGDVRGRMYPEVVNSGVLLLVQIETAEAVANADEIASVPGVDGLFYGPDDTLLSRGLAMDTPKTPAFIGADLRVVGEACRRHGKLAVTLAFSSELVSFCLGTGYRMLAVGADISFLTAASSRAVAEVRGQVKAHVPGG